MRGFMIFAFPLLVACSAPKAPNPRYPSRPQGCDVRLFHRAPTMDTENLGPVMSSCADTVRDDDCLRQLLDETCKLGGDVVWGVDDAPVHEENRNVWRGRAAHTKSASSR